MARDFFKHIMTPILVVRHKLSVLYPGGFPTQSHQLISAIRQVPGGGLSVSHIYRRIQLGGQPYSAQITECVEVRDDGHKLIDFSAMV